MTINNIIQMNVRTIILSTESGSQYMLYEENGETFFSKGIHLSGRIVKLHEEIKIGGSLHIDFCKHNIYNQLQDSVMFLKSPPITRITLQ